MQNQRSLFRTGLKLLGIYLFVMGGSQLIMMTGAMFFNSSWFQRGTGAADWIGMILMQILPSALQVAAGWYCLFRGEWLVNLAIQRIQTGCPNCEYPIEHRENIEQCPECGIRLSPKDAMTTNAPSSDDD